MTAPTKDGRSRSRSKKEKKKSSMDIPGIRPHPIVFLSITVPAALIWFFRDAEAGSLRLWEMLFLGGSVVVGLIAAATSWCRLIIGRTALKKEWSILGLRFGRQFPLGDHSEVSCEEHLDFVGFSFYAVFAVFLGMTLPVLGFVFILVILAAGAVLGPLFWIPYVLGHAAGHKLTEMGTHMLNSWAIRKSVYAVVLGRGSNRQMVCRLLPRRKAKTLARRIVDQTSVEVVRMPPPVAKESEVDGLI